MSILKNLNSRYLLLASSLLLLLIISAFAAFKYYIPAEIRKHLFLLAESNDIALDLERLTYNPFEGLVIRGIEVKDLSEKNVFELDISKVKITPRIIPYLLRRDLIIDNLELTNTDLSVKEEIRDYISDTRKRIEEIDRELISDRTALTVNNIDIRNMQLRYRDETSITIKNLHTKIEKRDQETQITIDGSFGNEMVFELDIKLSDILDDGSVIMNLSNIKPGRYLLNDLSMQTLSLHFNGSFKQEEHPAFWGEMRIFESDTRNSADILEMNFGAYYNEATEYIRIEYLRMLAQDSTINSEGYIHEVGANPSIILDGYSDEIEITSLGHWLPYPENHIISGHITSAIFSVNGKPLDRELTIRSEFDIKDLSYKNLQRDIEVIGIEGGFAVQADIYGNEYKLGSRYDGVVSAEFARYKNLELKTITSTGSVIVSDGSTFIEMNDISAGWIDGKLNGAFSAMLSEGALELTSDIKGSGLDIGIIGDLTGYPVAGRPVDIEASVRVDNESLESDFTLKADELSYNFEDSSIGTSYIRTSTPLKLKLLINDNKMQFLSIDGKDIELDSFYYGDFRSDSNVTITSAAFNFRDSSHWSLDLSAAGEKAQYSHNYSIDSGFLLNLIIDSKDYYTISGKINSLEASFEDITLRNLETDFSYTDNLLDLENTTFISDNYGSFKVSDMQVRFSESENDPHTVRFRNGEHEYSDGINTYGITGNMLIEREQNIIKGTLNADKLNIHGVEITVIRTDFEYSDEKLVLNELNARKYGGIIKAKGFMDTPDGNEERKFHLELALGEMADIHFAQFMEIDQISLNLNGTLNRGLIKDAYGSLMFENLSLTGETGQAYLEGYSDIKISSETISFTDGFIKDRRGNVIKIEGEVYNLFDENRGSTFTISETPVSYLADILSPLLPEDLASGEYSGTVSLVLNTYNLFETLSNWRGSLVINDAGFSGQLSETIFELRGVEGVITIKDQSKHDNILHEIMGTELVVSKEMYKEYRDLIRDIDVKVNGDHLSIDHLRFGFLTMNEIDCIFEIDKEKINLIHFHTRLYGGDLYGNGILGFWEEDKNYSVSLIFDDLSLMQLTESIPSFENYITGIVYGLLWFTLDDSYWTIDGPFTFWTKDSRDERRTIGRALLEKIGAKGRFFTRSSRRYDKGIISGYIKDGFMTFRELEISNTFLFYRDLLIQVDPVMNTISVKHLLSVIRELARRTGEGDIRIEFE